MSGRPRAFDAIIYGGATVAILDAANAVVFWWLYRGTRPVVIFQSIAAGLLGRESFSGGVTTASLGAVLHCVISLGVATAYYFAARNWSWLRARPVMSGVLYGGIVYAVMNRVVIPLSNARQPSFNPAWFAANFGGHLLLIGLPLAFIVHWSAQRKGGEVRDRDGGATSVEAP